MSKKKFGSSKFLSHSLNFVQFAKWFEIRTTLSVDTCVEVLLKLSTKRLAERDFNVDIDYSVQPPRFVIRWSEGNSDSLFINGKVEPIENMDMTQISGRVWTSNTQYLLFFVGPILMVALLAISFHVMRNGGLTLLCGICVPFFVVSIPVFLLTPFRERNRLLSYLEEEIRTNEDKH